MLCSFMYLDTFLSGLLNKTKNEFLSLSLPYVPQIFDSIASYRTDDLYPGQVAHLGLCSWSFNHHLSAT